MSVLIVEKCGPYASVQDAGRSGVRHLGLTQGGALDWLAQHWANWMLGNALDAAVVEITLGGLQLQCQGEGWLALAGADLGATLDGQPLAVWQPFAVKAGQRLRFASPRLGARAYLAVPGGVRAPSLAGSCATVSREGVGGLDGRASALREGDRLMGYGEGGSPGAVATGLADAAARHAGSGAAGGDAPEGASGAASETASRAACEPVFSAASKPATRVVSSAAASACAPRAVPTALIPDLRSPVHLELILGAQASGFTGQSLFNAFNQPWTVDVRSDRMGLRLTGEPLHYSGPGLISEGIPLGAVQVPPDGQPIILLNDRQTIGGYPRLGALSPLAVARLAQCLPGETVRLWPQVTYAAQQRQQRCVQALRGAR